MSDLSKRDTKEAKYLDTTKFVFTEVDLDSVKVKFGRAFYVIKKNAVAKCKICDTISKRGNGTSNMSNYLEKLHKISVTTVESTSEQPPAKKMGIENFFVTKTKPPRIVGKIDFSRWILVCSNCKE